MNLQQYLNLSNEEYEFLLEEADFKELGFLFLCLDFGVEPDSLFDIKSKYLQEFNRRKANMSK